MLKRWVLRGASAVTVMNRPGTAADSSDTGVADAKPAYEYNESVTKAKAVFRAVEVAADEPPVRGGSEHEPELERVPG